MVGASWGPSAGGSSSRSHFVMARYTRHSGCMHTLAVKGGHSSDPLMGQVADITAWYPRHSGCMQLSRERIPQSSSRHHCKVHAALRLQSMPRLAKRRHGQQAARPYTACLVPQSCQTCAPLHAADSVPLKTRGWLNMQECFPCRHAAAQRLEIGCALQPTDTPRTRLRLAQLPDPEHRLLEAQAVCRVEADHRSPGAVVVPTGPGAGLRSRTSVELRSCSPLCRFPRAAVPSAASLLDAMRSDKRLRSCYRGGTAHAAEALKTLRACCVPHPQGHHTTAANLHLHGAIDTVQPAFCSEYSALVCGGT